MKKRDDKVIRIDLVELLFALLPNLWIMILAAVICGGAGYAYSKYSYHPLYESTTSIYIMNKRSFLDRLTTSDTMVASELTKDYARLITSRTVLETVIADEQFSNETYSSLKGRISITNTTDTRILDISVRDSEPMRAQALADAIRIVATEHIKDVIVVEAVNLVDPAYLPTSPCNSAGNKYMLMGALAGGGLAGAFFVIRFVLDSTIKTEEDIEEFLGLSTLALIPEAKRKVRKSKKVGLGRKCC